MMAKYETMTDTSISSALFSKVQKRLLALIFGRPDRSFYMSEIIKIVQSGTGAVERELSRLERSGLVSVERIGNQKHYRANTRSPIYAEIHSLVQKTVGLREPLKDALEPYAPKIKAAFVYGSMAKKSDTARSDVDLMVLGDDITYSDLYCGLEEAEKILNRPINPTIMDIGEWRKKRTKKNAFIDRIERQPKIFVFGSEDELKL